jgi:hypothetical protein
MDFLSLFHGHFVGGRIAPSACLCWGFLIAAVSYTGRQASSCSWSCPRKLPMLSMIAIVVYIPLVVHPHGPPCCGGSLDTLPRPYTQHANAFPPDEAAGPVRTADNR